MILNACNNELFDPGRDQQRSTRYSFNVLHGIRSTFYTVFVHPMQSLSIIIAIKATFQCCADLSVVQFLLQCVVCIPV